MLIVQYKNDKWASAQREFNNPRICFWAAKHEKLITRKYQRLQYMLFQDPRNPYYMYLKWEQIHFYVVYQVLLCLCLKNFWCVEGICILNKEGLGNYIQ